MALNRGIIPVSMKHGLRTADYGLRTEYKIPTMYKTRTGKYGLVRGTPLYKPYRYVPPKGKGFWAFLV